MAKRSTSVAALLLSAAIWGCAGEAPTENARPLPATDAGPASVAPARALAEQDETIPASGEEADDGAAARTEAQQMPDAGGRGSPTPGVDIMPPVMASVTYDDDSFARLREQHPGDDALMADLREMYPEQFVKNTLAGGMSSISAGAYTMAFDAWIDVADPDGTDGISRRHARGFRGAGSASAGHGEVYFKVEFYDGQDEATSFYVVAADRGAGEVSSVEISEDVYLNHTAPAVVLSGVMEQGTGPLAAACGAFGYDVMRRHCETYLADMWGEVIAKTVRAPWTAGAEIAVSLSPYPETTAAAAADGSPNLRLTVTTPGMLENGLPGVEVWTGGPSGRIVAARLDLTEAVSAELPQSSPAVLSSEIVVDIGGYMEWGS